MNGSVAAGQAIIGVSFRLVGQPELILNFLIDTGFAGHLTLPSAAVEAMGLPFIPQIEADLADDSTVYVNVHAATVVWDGQERVVGVLATGARPLLGTLLLDGHTLTVAFTEGGAVTVEPL